MPTNIGSDNGLSPVRRLAIIWTKAEILLIGPLGTNFSEILIKIYIFSFKKMHFKLSLGNWWPFCLSLNMLTNQGLNKMAVGVKPPHNTFYYNGTYGVIRHQWVKIVPEHQPNSHKIMVWSDDFLSISKTCQWLGWQFISPRLITFQIYLKHCYKVISRLWHWLLCSVQNSISNLFCVLGSV